ncbi:unnamed protein product, partial [Mesorhabditis belari]|uniref:DNA-directed RNA polymerase subunit n=1 Tax=Mesorhabditis belari TaxID=2138241 RepID=A0AAF3F2M9_9BILA
MNLEKLKQGDDPYMQFDKMHFRNYLPAEIEKLSILKITSTKTFDSVGQPVPNGLYDGRMGANEQYDTCGTCHLSDIYCPGHVGHIELCVPVFNPMHFRFLFSLMKGTCMHCHGLFLDSTNKKARQFLARLRCIELNLPDLIPIVEAELENLESRTQKTLETYRDPTEEFNRVLESFIEEKTKASIKQLQASVAHVKPHKTLVDLKYHYLKEFQLVMFKRVRKCPRCTRINGSIFNDDMRCIIIDFTNTKKDKSSMRKGKPTPDEDASDEEEEALIEEKKDVKDGGVLAGNAANTGAEALQRQLQSILEGKCQKLAWRGAEMREHFRLVWAKDGHLLRKCFPMFEDESNGCPLDGLFCEAVLVPPNKFRPIRMMAGDRYEHPASVNLRKLLEANEAVKCLVIIMENSAPMKRPELIDFVRRMGIFGNSEHAMMHQAYKNLQNRMNLIFDADADKYQREEQKIPGIKQILEKKEGLFRMNMMGKRVNYACRSVITPDPYLDVDEIGIPEVFAKKLTFAEPVNALNIKQMRKLVKKGPNQYPGANGVLTSVGKKIILVGDKDEEREAMSKQLHISDANRLRAPFKVLRHVKKGDLFVMNRQPSLHKPSMMGHRARILKGQRALRLNYAPCKAYNADFDGDEMNGHFTQSYQAQVEVGEIANVGNNFLVPKDASPLLGLIQDHVVSGVLLTLRGRMFNREDFMHLVLAAFSETTQRLEIPPPCMIKPERLWSGKQVISTIVLNCIPAGYPKVNLTGKAKTPVKCWKVREKDPPTFRMSESEVIFRQGELLCGVLDKNHFGASEFGLTHCFFDLYGHRTGIKILSCFSRLFTTYLQYHGFTLGVADILCLPNADKRRKKAIKGVRTIGDQVAIDAFGLGADASQNEIKLALAATYCNPKGVGADLAALDRTMKRGITPYNDKINKACVPDGLVRLFPQNGLQMMIESGAKGSTVNAMQISCSLGQIELEGKRMAATVAGRTLPSFRSFDSSPRAGGYIDQRFMTGINPQELFFHTMAGREGLIDTAVKTSRSGYLQRCIIKHLEGIKVHYDATCRDHDGSIIQFRYGEDGMDVCESSYMTSADQYEFMRSNLDIIEKSVKPEGISARDLQIHEATEHYEKVKKHRKTILSLSKRGKGRNAAFCAFSFEHTGTKKEDIVKMWQELSEDERDFYRKSVCGRVMDTVDEAFNSTRTLGALPEAILDKIDSFSDQILKKYEKITQIREKSGSRLFEQDEDLLNAERLKRTLYWKGMKSRAVAGENVGLLAAQSIGEPSTQMTLNTFHFAGRGEMNVTLGIPRLREILMTSGKNIATPTAEICLHKHACASDVEKIKQVLDRIYLRQVLKCFTVEERVNVQKGIGQLSSRRFVLRLELLKKSKREKELRHISNRKILAMIEALHKDARSNKKKEADGDDEGQIERGVKGFIQKLTIELQKKLTATQKEEAIHIKRVRIGNLELGLTKDNQDGLQDRFNKRQDAGDSSDEEAAGGKEADADERRLHNRHRDDAAEYEGEEEDREALPDREEEEHFENEDLEDKEDLGYGDEAKGSDENGEEAQNKRRQSLASEIQRRVESVRSISPNIDGYKFDQNNNLWCELTIKVPLVVYSKIDFAKLVGNVVDSFVVSGVRNIEKCVYDPDRNILSTQGVNREVLFAFSNILDMNTFYSNDLTLMLDLYGIESCAKAIVKEMSNVFGVYGIRPSKRHLTLTADYMTFNGDIQPFNRTAMNSSASPLQKMTFETTIDFMRKSLINGDVDHLSSPSARIVLGSLNRGGTGAFDVFVDPQQLLEQ